jgi:NADH-quinone oxidoreductase subunit C
MQTKDIFSKLKSKFNDMILELVETEHFEPFITIAPAETKNIMMFLRDEDALQFDYMSCLTGIDNKDSFAVVYHLYSTTLKHSIVVKVILAHDKPQVPSVERIWKTANWHERETYDMYGIYFDGHPDLERILCPDDWVGFPLRKDYVAPTEWHGIDATSNN